MTLSSPPVGANASVEAPAGLLGRWLTFWFGPTNPLALHAVRIVAGLAFLAWLLPLAGNVGALYGPDGWIDLRAYKEIGDLPRDGDTPRTGWSVLWLAGTSTAATIAIYWACVVSILLFTLGVWPRLTAVLTWIAVLSFTGNPVLLVEAHPLFVVLATYLMVGYLLLGQESSRLTAAARLLGPVRPFRGDPELARPSMGPAVALRLLQVHLAIIVVFSGLHKLQFGDWWHGVAFWYPLNSSLAADALSVRQHAEHAPEYLTFLSIMAYLALGWQILFPLFAWQRWTWVLAPVGGLVACVATPILYGDPLFGMALLAGCIGFVPARVWECAIARLKRLMGHEQPATPAVEPRKPGRKSDRTEYMAGARQA